MKIEVDVVSDAICPWCYVGKKRLEKAIAAVKGTLVCDTDGSASGGNSVLVDTQMVELDERGNARFNGSVGALPAVCISEPDVAFLIRVGAGRWIANGTVLR